MTLCTQMSCKKAKTAASDLDIEFTQDTLAVGYTYWWSESGPFIGECGEKLSFVFSGTVTDILAPTEEAGPLYYSQKGFIHINQVFKIKDIGANSYTNQQFFVSDCFNGLELKKEDKVLVFCYDYENDFSIPGGSSILKIDSFEDPLITSIKKYIDAEENPTAIKNDIKLWEKHDLGSDLEQIIRCHETGD
jgi:hypothetical protein